jgi:4a-hydroxytetrahydrobiopterin dehydratase
VSGRIFEVAIDANEPERLRPFWAAALRYVEQVTGEGAVDLVDPAGRGPTVWFQHVPEPKTVKNRVHLDIRVPRTERSQLAHELVSLGGRVLREHPRFTVLADAEGNEVCLTDMQDTSADEES